MADLNIAVWGPTSAGKTMLIARLYEKQSREIGGWTVLPTKTSLDFIDQKRAEIRDSNRFPPATGADDVREIVYHFRNMKTNQQAALSIEDRPGRDWEALGDEARERLGSAAGLILLFDPRREQSLVASQIERTLEQLYVSRSDGEIDDRPIAVCVSKADLLFEGAEDVAKAMDDPHGYVAEYLGDGTLQTLSRFCSRFQLFPVTAAGIELRYGVLEPVVFYDDALVPRIRSGGTPMFMAPLVWLFEQLTEAS